MPKHHVGKRVFVKTPEVTIGAEATVIQFDRFMEYDREKYTYVEYDSGSRHVAETEYVYSLPFWEVKQYEDQDEYQVFHTNGLVGYTVRQPHGEWAAHLVVSTGHHLHTYRRYKTCTFRTAPDLFPTKDDAIRVIKEWVGHPGDYWRDKV
ncbi:hypothetical protein [Acrocarpospora sp. B8E8]|uniref:hypothetical protein n=1 Tax=Acrocarpospora sp. B8E8 TaxID=3153572 RepID=UPI00325E8999